MNIDKLNKKEKHIFNRIGQGVKASKIAQELGISVNTVHTYRFRILRALGLSSTTELVKLWVWEKFKESKNGQEERYQGWRIIGHNEHKEILNIKD